MSIQTRRNPLKIGTFDGLKKISKNIKKYIDFYILYVYTYRQDTAREVYRETDGSRDFYKVARQGTPVKPSKPS